MKKIFLFALVIAVLLSLLVIASSQALKKDKVDKAVWHKLQSQKTARVILVENSSKIKTAQVTTASLEELSSNPNITAIELDKPFKLFLQDAVGIINASITWPLQFSGINLTGVNRTVCVIDSGVNASHPDLAGKVIHQFCYCSISESGNSSCCPDGTSEDSSATDNNGHGTHVSGIIAASGGINGIAPKTNLVVIKVTNSTGDGVASDLVNAINYCVNNASIFNISVISLSLGGGSSTGFCDSDFASTSAAINAAYAKNISVVAATGNSGSTTQITWPACIENATPVGATAKDDTIASYSNRNSLVQLLAPGGSSSGQINSTCISSDSSTGYCTKYGTSMAAPMVSGAIAVITEFLNLSGRTRTPRQIETLLNNTGKLISENGLNYSRINLYQAVISLDNTVPSVTLSSPANNTITINRNQTFICNGTDLALKNATLFIYNSSILYNQTASVISGASSSAQFNLTNLPIDSYKWNCLFSDENSNSAFASSNFSLTVESLVVSLISPGNNIFTKQNQTFSCNATSSINALSNVTFYLYNSSSLENTTFRTISALSNVTNITYNFAHEDTYTWNCLFVNNVSTANFASSNSTLTYDLTSPLLTIVSPSNGSYSNVGSFNASLNETGTCRYSLDYGITNNSMSTTDNKIFTTQNSTLLQGNNYNLTYYCNDSSGNINNSQLINFNIDLSKPNVTAISPENGHADTGTIAVTFSFNFSDNLNVTACSLILNNAIAQTNSAIADQTQSYSLTQTISPGSYTWQINCTDLAGNIGNSSSRTLTINSPSVSTSSGGGGGGSGGGGGATETTYSLNSNEIINGSSKQLKAQDKIRFQINNLGVIENHTIEVINIGNYSINITIKSEIINATLYIGDTKKFDLTKDNIYDISVKLENIILGKASLVVRSISEPISSQSETFSEEKTQKDAMPASGGIRISLPLDIILEILAAAAVIGTAYYFIHKKIFKARREKQIKNELKKIKKRIDKLEKIRED